MKSLAAKQKMSFKVAFAILVAKITTLETALSAGRNALPANTHAEVFALIQPTHALRTLRSLLETSTSWQKSSLKVHLVNRSMSLLSSKVWVKQPWNLLMLFVINLNPKNYLASANESYYILKSS